MYCRLGGLSAGTFGQVRNKESKENDCKDHQNENQNEQEIEYIETITEKEIYELIDIFSSINYYAMYEKIRCSLCTVFIILLIYFYLRTGSQVSSIPSLRNIFRSTSDSITVLCT